VFPAAALAGRGRIGDTELRCETPEWSLRWHTGYPPRAEDHHDVPLLCQRFGLELPEIYRD
jgi:lincosamide nucleotidyltransferase A/C/D/E